MLKKTLLCAAALSVAFQTFVGLRPAEIVKANTTIPFTVHIEKNELQDPAIGTWFDWDVSEHKGKKVAGALTVKNGGQETITLDVRTTNALTSTTGGVDYNKADHTDLSSFVDESYAFKNNITGLPKTITLQAGETKEIPFNVLVPENAVGEYVSSIGFYHSNDEGTNVRREFGLNTTIRIRASKEVIEPATFSNVKATMTKQTPRLTIDISNVSPMVNPEVKETYKIIDKRTDETVLEGTIGPFKMAPSTKITYAINWSGEIAEGSYTLLLGNGEKFDFKLTANYIKEVEQVVEDVSIVERGLPWYYVSILTILGLVLVLFVVWVAHKHLRKKKELEASESETTNSEE